MNGIHNARITRTMLGPEDHGIFTAMISLDFGGTGQGFGGYSLKDEYAYRFISRVLEVVGVREWEQLPGNIVRADRQGGLLRGLGHAIEDRWFYPGQEWEGQP